MLFVPYEKKLTMRVFRIKFQILAGLLLVVSPQITSAQHHHHGGGHMNSGGHYGGGTIHYGGGHYGGGTIHDGGHYGGGHYGGGTIHDGGHYGGGTIHYGSDIHYGGTVHHGGHVDHSAHAHVIPSVGHQHHGTYYVDGGQHYYYPQSASVGPVTHTVARPVQIAFGGFAQVEDLSGRLEMLVNEMCLDLHHNYSHNPGYAETYREAYQILEVAKYIHAAEHANDREAIRSRLNGMDAQFHHVQGDVRGWSRHHHVQVGQLGIITKMDMIESTLHHLMNDVGVQTAPAPAPGAGAMIAPPPAGGAPAPLNTSPPSL